MEYYVSSVAPIEETRVQQEKSNSEHRTHRHERGKHDLNAPLSGSPRCIVLAPSGFSPLVVVWIGCRLMSKKLGCRTERFTKECA